MDWLNLYLKRVCFWFRFVGRDWEGRIGPVLAWELACIIYPPEFVNKWWYYTGWFGPGSDLYVYPVLDYYGEHWVNGEDP